MPYTDSASAEVTLALSGVWLHDPLDAEGTAADYPYGRANREHGIDTGGVATLYAGREYAVAEYGEHTGEPLSIAVQVANGPTFAADVSELEDFARSRRVLWLRDNRGRSFAGVMEGFRIKDERFGATVSFTFDRRHYAVTEVAA
jgi:hypothetical protein